MSDGSSDFEQTIVQESSASAADGFELGQIVGGKYKIVSLLGRGGIGSVHKVEQVFLGQSFALKTLNSQTASDQLIRRFQNEARAASSLSHANLVKVIDFGLLEGQRPYLVMDLVEGLTLSEFLKQNGPLNLEQAVGCFTQVCLGLSYAHDQGIIHRDIKPSNVMIFSSLPFGAEGFVKVVDFGIAKIAYAEDGEAQSLTTTGEVFGSPLYMSPEQCSGLAVDHRTDIYSLGCVLFEALTGTTPFVGPNALSTMMLHQQERVPTLKEASLGKDFSPELEQIVGKLLEKAPADRYQNLGVVANDLSQLFKGAPLLGVKSNKMQNKRVDVPIKMSRREFHLRIIFTALSAGIIGGGIGYLANSPSVKSNLEKCILAFFQPVKSSKKESSSPLFEGMTVNEMDKYEPLLAKVDNDSLARDFEKKYYAAKGIVDKARFEDKEKNQKGLDQLTALQKEFVAYPQITKQFHSPIEERIAFCNLRMGLYREAEKHLILAMKLAASLEQEGEVANTYQIMADLASREKRFRDAFSNYHTAARIREKVYSKPGCDPNMGQQARLLAGISYRSCCIVLAQQILDFKRAIEMGEKSRRLLEPLNDKYQLGVTLAVLGDAYERDNQDVTARKFLSASEQYLVGPNLPRDAPFILGCALNELSAIDAKSHDFKSAIEFSKRSLKALARFKSNTKAEQDVIADLKDKILLNVKSYERAIATQPAGGNTSPTASESTSPSASAPK